MEVQDKELTKEEIWALLSKEEKEIIAGGCQVLPDKDWLLTRIGQAFPAVGLDLYIVNELFKNLGKLRFPEESKWLISFYYDQFFNGKK
ncbi:MAG TPA: hypothetical protein ENG63_04735 [Candidatus Desulfofervidus auxilii]|uniref:Uncharacterized protein n=1 Tax=Desulfofervidus auxilii TaxID=1621989 RepID=A0A7C0Y9A8_DESA2|nr:hypothetical protein [Candidatus Desulfofervidus auxilii]HDD44151.1 hypothetical protein [Candidatus Desulfofervidus auxilii]